MPAARLGALRYAVVALAIVAVGLATAPPPAAAAGNCAARIFKDWTDNRRVDHVYSLPCYRKAIKSLPVDVKSYSSAEDDIRRAMLYAQSGKSDPGRKAPPAPSTAPRRTSSGAPATTGPASSNAYRGRAGTPQAGMAASAPRLMGSENAAQLSQAALPVPLPLIALAAVSTILLGAGGVGYLARRFGAHPDGDA